MSLTRFIKRLFNPPDKAIILIVYLGFTSVVSISSLQDLQNDAVAHKGIRIGSILLAFFWAFLVFCVRDPFKYIQKPTVFQLFLFVCACFSTTLWSALPLLTVFKSLELFLVVIICLIGIASKQKPSEIFEWVLLLFSIQLSIVWIEALVFPSLAFRNINGVTPFLEAMLQGVYPVVNPNTVGFLGGVVAVVSLPRLFSSHQKRWIYFFGFAFGIVTVIASYSRGALTATLIVCCLFLVFSRKKIAITFLLAIAVVVVASGNHLLLLEHFQRGKEYTDVSGLSSGRLDIWSIIMANLSDYIFGNGYAVGFRYAAFLGNTNAHNSIFELLVGCGFIGVIMWLLIYCRLLYGFFILRNFISINASYWNVFNALLYLLITSFTNVRGAYLDMGMLLLVSIIVYIEKLRLENAISIKLKGDGRLAPPSKKMTL